MFRTRDFILFFAAIVFLLVAISTTTFSQLVSTPVNETQTIFQPADTTEVSYGATEASPEILSREARLAEMRQKIAEGGLLTISTAEPEIASEVEETEIDPAELAQTIVCPTPALYTGSWPRGVQHEVREGARIFYTESTAAQPAAGTSTPQATTEQVVLLELSVPFGPSAQPTCPTSDVVGVAQDGSLIRNFEIGLYSVFGENTLIGYALDGFPIYGVSSIQTDECGGAVVGTYRYYLSDSNETIISCFGGVPIKL